MFLSVFFFKVFANTSNKSYTQIPESLMLYKKEKLETSLLSFLCQMVIKYHLPALPVNQKLG